MFKKIDSKHCLELFDIVLFCGSIWPVSSAIPPVCFCVVLTRFKSSPHPSDRSRKSSWAPRIHTRWGICSSVSSLDRLTCGIESPLATLRESKIFRHYTHTVTGLWCQRCGPWDDQSWSFRDPFPISWLLNNLPPTWPHTNRPDIPVVLCFQHWIGSPPPRFIAFNNWIRHKSTCSNFKFEWRGTEGRCPGIFELVFAVCNRSTGVLAVGRHSPKSTRLCLDDSTTPRFWAVREPERWDV